MDDEPHTTGRRHKNTATHHKMPHNKQPYPTTERRKDGRLKDERLKIYKNGKAFSTVWVLPKIASQHSTFFLTPPFFPLLITVQSKKERSQPPFCQESCRKLPKRTLTNPTTNQTMSMDHVNLDELKRDVDNLKAELIKIQKENKDREMAHLNKIIFISNLFTFTGWLTAGLPWYTIVPWVFVSTGTFARWTMIAHHTCHGGYDTAGHERFNRRKFALGSLSRRCNDWLDWMLPEAWNIEHNNLHHYSLGEVLDPDLVEENLSSLRESPLPLWLKRVVVFVMACTWKWFYYAPNTYKQYALTRLRQKDEKAFNDLSYTFKTHSYHITNFFTETQPFMSGLFSICMAPYAIFNFLLIPMTWFAFGVLSMGTYGAGVKFGLTAFFNMILAEIFTNLHSFLVIVTNHAGDDLYRFDTPCKPLSGEFYLRQIISSANFDAGNDFTDYLHGWLNYQVEHHLFPSLSMLSYRRAMPVVKQICKKHKIPYVQQNVFSRLWKTVDIMIGKTSMKRLNNGSESRDQ